MKIAAEVKGVCFHILVQALALQLFLFMCSAPQRTVCVLCSEWRVLFSYIDRNSSCFLRYNRPLYLTSRAFSKPGFRIAVRKSVYVGQNCDIVGDKESL